MDTVHAWVFKVFNAQKNALRPHLAALGLSTGQPKVLRVLARRSGCMQKEVATECGVEPATVSRLVESLEKSGLLARRVDDGNRRAAQLFLTSDGEAAYARLEAVLRENDARALAGFSEAERLQFGAYLRRMYENLTSL